MLRIWAPYFVLVMVSKGESRWLREKVNALADGKRGYTLANGSRKSQPCYVQRDMGLGH